MNWLLLWMPTHKQIFLIPTLILEIFLIYNIEVLWAYPTMPDHTHLIVIYEFLFYFCWCLSTWKNQLSHHWYIQLSRILNSWNHFEPQLKNKNFAIYVWKKTTKYIYIFFFCCWIWEKWIFPRIGICQFLEIKII